jgi:hypothetical protein
MDFQNGQENANEVKMGTVREFLVHSFPALVSEAHICYSSSSHGSALVHPNAPDRLTLPADSINQPPIHSTGSSEVRNTGPSRPTTSLYQYVDVFDVSHLTTAHIDQGVLLPAALAPHGT